MSPKNSASIHSKEQDLEAPIKAYEADEEFGGHEARKNLERKLLRKLDLRMSILVVIYILNYVRIPGPLHARSLICLGLLLRSTAITLALRGYVVSRPICI